MVSDAEISAAVQAHLLRADLEETTTTSLRHKLEKDFGVDLYDRLPFIRDQITLFIQSSYEAEPQRADELPAGEVTDEVVEDDHEEAASEIEDDEEGEDYEAEISRAIGKKRKLNKLHKEGMKKTAVPTGFTFRWKKLHKEEKEKEKSAVPIGFARLCSISPLLQEFVGVPEIARTEVIKKIWLYIREHNLQDPDNKRRIICDDKLQTLLEADSIDMFQMTKALAKHILPLASEKGSTKTTRKAKQLKKERAEGSHEMNQGEKRRRGGFLAPISLSDSLVKFLGIEENELPRTNVVKRMWDYIKQNNLQDPADKRIVICDEKLKELFKVESFHGFSVTKLLADHLYRAEQ